MLSFSSYLYEPGLSATSLILLSQVRLMELLGLKMPVVDVLTRYRSSLGGSIPWDLLICRFGLGEYPVAY